MAKRLLLSLGLPLLLALTAGCLNVAPLVAGKMRRVTVQESPRLFEPYRIALIDVDGFLASGDGWSLFGGTTVADVKEKLNLASDDRRVRAVVLRINSPGGEVAASDVLYQELLGFKRETGKPVVAALMGTAASGAYYVALAADSIVASPTTVTGSIGVVIDLINAEELLAKIGLRSEVVKSGAKKDMGSPTRALTPEERKILQDINRSLFERFLAVLRTGRPRMTEKDIALLSDGRVVTAQQALELNMVDQVGYLEDALAEARRLAGIGGADVILYRPFPRYAANIYARSALEPAFLGEVLKLVLRRRGPAFLYLWSPGS